MRSLRVALDDVGLAAVAVQTQVVADLEQATACSFVGSPTFLINGRDPFTGLSGPCRSPALACRIHRTR